MPKTIEELKQTKTAGGEAFTLKAEMILAQPVEQNDGDESQSAMVKFRARSKDVLNHRYWGPCVHDFEGMEFSGRGIIDYSHEDVIGKFSKVEFTDYGLEIEGELVGVTEAAREAIGLLKADVPMQASINFCDDDIQIEYIPDGVKTKLNGTEYEGPLMIFRKWPLRGVAVTPYGYDSNTESSLLSSKGKEFTFSITEKEQDMAENANKDKTAEEPEVTSEPETQTETETPPAETTPEETETNTDTEPSGNDDETKVLSVQDVAKKFSAAFGDKGLEYMANGMTFAAASEEHLKYQSEQLAAKDKRIAELSAREPESGVASVEENGAKNEKLFDRSIPFQERMAMARKQ